MNSGWNINELQATVEAYIDMLNKEQCGKPFIKKNYYKELAHNFGRTEKSFKYRMENISYVRVLMGRSWLTGLKPAKNIGARITGEIERLLNEAEGKQHTPIAQFEAGVRGELRKAHSNYPTGNPTPKTIFSQTTQYQ